MVTSPFPTLFVLLHVPYGIQIQSSLLPMIEVKIRNRLSAFLGPSVVLKWSGLKHRPDLVIFPISAHSSPSFFSTFNAIVLVSYVQDTFESLTFPYL